MAEKTRKPITKKEVKQAGSLRGAYEKRAKQGAERGMTKAQNFPRRVVERIEKTERPTYFPGQEAPKAPAAQTKKVPKMPKVGKELIDIFEEKTKLVKETYE